MFLRYTVDPQDIIIHDHVLQEDIDLALQCMTEEEKNIIDDHHFIQEIIQDIREC